MWFQFGIFFFHLSHAENITSVTNSFFSFFFFFPIQFVKQFFGFLCYNALYEKTYICWLVSFKTVSEMSHPQLSIHCRPKVLSIYSSFTFIYVSLQFLLTFGNLNAAKVFFCGDFFCLKSTQCASKPLNINTLVSQGPETALRAFIVWPECEFALQGVSYSKRSITRL